MQNWAINFLILIFTEICFKGAIDGLVWTSGSRDPGKLFMWDSTGQTLGSYLNWAEGEPDIGAVLNETQLNCVVLNSTDQFKWYDHGCKTAELRYICEKKGINYKNV
jgi:hypothetical protein